MVILAALSSALCYAAASVLQHHSASGAPDHECLKPSLLVRLARQPLWLIGILADVGGFAFQFWALGHGPMVLVQPLLVSGLLFALPLGALAARRSIPPGDLLGAVAVVAGLGLFLGVAQPGPGRQASPEAWIVAAGCTVVPVGLAAAVAVFSGAASVRKARWLGVAAGISYGFAAALVVATAHVLRRHGLWHCFVSWQLYALVVAGLLTLLIGQSAFQAGPLSESLPIITAVDPVVSIVIGCILLRETIVHSPIALLGEVIGLGIMTVGIMVDGRSVLVSGEASRVRSVGTAT